MHGLQEEIVEDKMCNCQTNCSCKPFDPSKPVQTRDGRSARILATDFKATSGYNWSIVAAIKNVDDTETLYKYYSNGSFGRGLKTPEEPHHLDLVNVPEIKVVYRNIYKEGSAAKDRASLEETRKAGEGAYHTLIGTMKMTLTDGKLMAVELVE
jgi:hypothetical protein